MVARDRVAAVRDEPLEGQVTSAGPKHILKLGDIEFECADTLPLGTLIRYAENDLLGIHNILVKVVHPDDHEEMWDAFENLTQDEVMEAVRGLVESYSARPTDGASSSRGGSRRTRRR